MAAASFADLQLGSQNDIPPLTIEPAYLPPDFSLAPAVCNDPNCNCQQASPSRSQNVITRSLSMGRPAPEMVGPFVLGPTLGRGQTGKVRLGVHKDTGFEVAIKIINKRLFKEDKRQRQRVEREVAILKLIDHPHVMKLYDVWETRRHLFIVMEHVDSGELFDYILRRGRLPRHEALRFIAQIVQGLEHCHLYSICHRDLKPENILLDRDHNVKIADFGMATIMKYGAHLNTSCGSPHYTSPEVVSGGKYDGKLSDVWSVGVVLFALVTAQLPFDHENTIGLLKIVRRGVYKIPDFVDPDIAELIQRMLTVQPEKRIRMWEIKHHRCFTSAPPVPLTYSVSPASRGPAHGHFSFLARRSSEPHVQKFEDTIHVTYFPQSAYEEDQRRCHGDCQDCIQNQDKLGYSVVACSNASRNSAHLGVAQAAPLKSADDIDINVLDDLFHLGWGSRNELIAVLLSPLPNLEQVFYHLLLQRKTERLKNLEDLQIGSSTPPQAPIAAAQQSVEAEPVIFLPPSTPTNNSAQIGSNPLASPLMPVGKHKVSSLPSPIGPHSATSAADVAMAAAVGTLIDDEYEAAMPIDPSLVADDESLPAIPMMPPAAVSSAVSSTLVMPQAQLQAVGSAAPTSRESSPRISVDIGKSSDVQIRLLALPDLIDETPALPRPSHSRALSDPMSAAGSRDAAAQPPPASRASTSSKGQEGAPPSGMATGKPQFVERGEANPVPNHQKPSQFSQQLPPNQPSYPVPAARRVESRVGSLSPVQRGLAAPIAPSSSVPRERDRWVAPQMERVEEGGSAVGSESAEECGSSRPPQPSPHTVDDNAHGRYGAVTAMSQLASAFSSAGIAEHEVLQLTTQLEGLTMPTEDKQALAIPELSLDAPFPSHPRSRSASSPRVFPHPTSASSQRTSTASSPVSPFGANFGESASLVPPAARFLPNPSPYGGSMPMIVNRDGIPMPAAVRHLPHNSITSSSLPNPAAVPAPGFCSPVSAVSTTYEASISSAVSAYSVPYPDADREFDDRERDSEPVTPSSTSTNPSFGSSNPAHSTATSPSPFAPQTPTVTYSTPRFHRTRVVPQNHPMLPRPAPNNTILQAVPVTPSTKRSWLSSLFNFAPPYPQKGAHNPARRTGPLPSTTVPNSMGAGIHYSPPAAVCSPDGLGPVASGQTTRATSLGNQPASTDSRSSASKRLPPLQLP